MRTQQPKEAIIQMCMATHFIPSYPTYMPCMQPILHFKLLRRQIPRRVKHICHTSQACLPGFTAVPRRNQAMEVKNHLKPCNTDSYSNFLAVKRDRLRRASLMRLM